MPDSLQASLEERLREESEGGRVVAAFFSTYTFSREFFENVSLPLITEDGERLGRFPVTVVVDRDQFSGQGRGYGVVCPPVARTWHAKLVLLYCREGQNKWTVLGVGSGNLTRAGWERNQELFRVSRHAGWRIPRCVDEWLDEPWLKQSAFAVWRRRSDVGALNYTENARLLGSWVEPIWSQVGWVAASRRWSEAHIVTPYCEQRETEDGPLRSPRGFFQRIAYSARDNAVLHLYLAGVPGRDKAVYGPGDFLGKQLPKLRFRTHYHRVDPTDGRPLHAKLFAFRIGNAWRLLTGSPNASGSALTDEAGNVELAVELRPGTRSLPNGFLPSRVRAIRLEELTFVEPPNHTVKRWHALQSARYLGPGEPLVVSWCNGHSFDDTCLRLGTTELLADSNVDLDEVEVRHLETRPRRRRPGIDAAYVPIELPPERFDAALEAPGMTAAQWLAALGAAADNAQGDPGHTATTRAGRNPQTTATFQWRDRVRDLLGRLQWLRDELREAESAQDIDRVTRLLEGVWHSHDPSTVDLSAMERAWRRWVRAGLWQALGSVGRNDRLITPIAALHERWRPKVPQKMRRYPIGQT
jgi:hypothetical protein